MLITTSRKPSTKTRQLCKALSRVFSAECINRGKMSMRDVFLKTSSKGYETTLIINDSQGNPSKITFYGNQGQEIVSLDVNIALPDSRLHIKPDDLGFKCEIHELSLLKNILPVKSDNEHNYSNLVWIKNTDKKYKAVMDFIDKNGDCTGLKIYIK